MAEIRTPTSTQVLVSGVVRAWTRDPHGVAAALVECDDGELGIYPLDVPAPVDDSVFQTRVLLEFRRVRDSRGELTYGWVARLHQDQGSGPVNSC
jgi:hypothetical protein